MKRLVLLLLAIVMMVGLVAEDKISTDLAKKMNLVRSDEKIPVVVLFEGLPSFDEIAKEYRFLGEEEIIKDQVIRTLKEKAESLHFWLKQMCENRSENVSSFRSIWLVNGVAINATVSAINEIASQPNVEKIVLDEPIPMLVESRDTAWGVTKIKSEVVWNLGYKGRGVKVAVVDTGVNEHNDLKGRVVDGKNFITPGTPPRDDHSHGTHCAGTVAGDGAAGTHTGVAPEATIMAVKVLGGNGSGQWSGLWEGMESTIEDKDVKILSMSLGGKPDETTRKRLRTACQLAISKGVIPVIAAGNSGSSPKTVGSPGDVPEIISVGATDSADNIAYFSSRGPVVWDGVEMIKPDVSAPGVNVNSTKHNVNNGYTTMSGTSMATPHVAGVVALMVNANPYIDVVKAKEALEKTATDLGTAGKDNNYGAGRVNADAAVNAVKTLSILNERGEERFEMVVKEMTFTATVDANGNINLSQTIENDLMPATVTIWVDVKEAAGRKGFYNVSFTLNGPNGQKTGTARVDYVNVPTDPNKYDAKYGYNCGNFDLVKGTYVGSVSSIEGNPQVNNTTITLTGKATWPARK